MSSLRPPAIIAVFLVIAVSTQPAFFSPTGPQASQPKTSANFAFTPWLEFADLKLSRHDIWVDADGGKIWFAYGGHLLRVPLPPKAK